MNRDFVKLLVIDFSYFTGCNFLRATHYYVDGKRVPESCYLSYLPRKYRDSETRQWSDKNRKGIRRDYTEVKYFL